MRYFMNISFRGARYHGWQVQPYDVSVQQTLEEALTRILGTPTSITGAGRTDAGVNARMMPAHFDADADIFDEKAESIIRSLNAICRPDIVVHEIVPVHDDAHARFDASLRTYRYFVHTSPNPFIWPLSWQSGFLDFEAMNIAAKDLLGTHDFTSFSKLHTDVKTNICTVHAANWVEYSPGMWYFEISADRFLRNMVRAVVGTLVDVGRRKYDTNHIRNILHAMDRCKAGTSMPAHALFLWQVEYPYPTFTKRGAYFPSL